MQGVLTAAAFVALISLFLRSDMSVLLVATNSHLHFALSGDNRVWSWDLGNRILECRAGSGQLGQRDGAGDERREVDARALQVTEASLTGESTAVAKHADPIAADSVLADRVNMAYAGTLVVAGQAGGLGQRGLGVQRQAVRGLVQGARGRRLGHGIGQAQDPQGLLSKLHSYNSAFWPLGGRQDTGDE